MKNRLQKKYVGVACLAMAVTGALYVVLSNIYTKNESQSELGTDSTSLTVLEQQRTTSAIKGNVKPSLVVETVRKPEQTEELGEELIEVASFTAEVITDDSIELPGMYLPLRILEPTEEQARVLYEATEELISGCMNERGFDYIPNAFYDDSVLDEQSEDRIVPGDTAVAQVRGYGLAESTMNHPDRQNFSSDDTGAIEPLASTGTGDPNDEVRATLSDEQQLAWDTALLGNTSSDSGTRVSVESPAGYGTLSWDSESCVATAREQLYESNVKVAENQWKEYSLQDQVYSTAEVDIDYQTAVSQWQNCMAGHGYDFNAPGEAANQLFERFQSGELSIDELRKLEIEIAPIEAVCYEQSAVGEAFNMALKRAESTLLIESSKTIDEIRVSRAGAIERARRKPN